MACGAQGKRLCNTALAKEAFKLKAVSGNDDGVAYPTLSTVQWQHLDAGSEPSLSC